MSDTDAANFLRHPKNREVVERMIGVLREGHRYMMRRYYIDSKTLKQIASECGISDHRISTIFVAANKLLTDMVKRMPSKNDTAEAESRIFKQAETGEQEKCPATQPPAEVRTKRPYHRRSKPEEGQGARAEFSLPLPQEVELVVRVKIIVEVVHQ